ncbi:hypothetical protein Tco_0811411 [Tanacetum coccineum]
MVAFLENPNESAGIKQIIDFLNASSIKYALTVNQTIYASCIQQFWDTVKVKTVNEIIQIQALVDKNKVIVTKASVRCDLQLDDFEGTKCLLISIIFEQLPFMCAKTTAWNEFSSTMASAIICLAINQKFNFSKYIFHNMVKNFEGGVNFLMYPRFVQVFLDKQVGDMSTHTKTYDAPCHTNKVFGNMKRVGKDFSRRVTPLFPTMLVQAQEEVGEGSVNPIDPHHTPTDSQPSISQPQQKQKLRKSKIKIIKVPHPSDFTANVPNEEHVLTPSNDPPLSVLALETTKITQALEIANLKIRVKKIDKKVSKRTHKLKRLYKENDNLIFDTSVFDSEEVVNTAEKEVSTADPVTTTGEVVTTTTLSITTADIEVITVVVITLIPNTSTIVTTIITPEEINLAQEITLAQAFATLKSIKPKVKDVVSPTIATTTITAITIDTRPKARGVVIQEPIPLKMKDQIRLDEELARKLEAEEQEAARLKRKEAKRQEQANIDLINSSDNVQAMIEADQLLAERLLAREQAKLTEEQKASLFMQLLEKRRKFFVAKRAKAKRNKPPTQA